MAVTMLQKKGQVPTNECHGVAAKDAKAGTEHLNVCPEDLRRTGRETMEEHVMVTVPVVSFLVVMCLFALAAFWIRHIRARREMERHFVTAEELHALLSSGREMLIFDLREPLDILTDSEIIPGAKVISPQKVFLNPFLIPQEKDSVIYCTCPSEATSRAVLKRALAMRFSRMKLLQGGLEGWKAKGYPVEPYTKPLHLDAGE